MDSKDTHNAKRELARLLQPCFADPPTAGAVILVNSAHGTRFFCVNMDSFEAVTTLTGGGKFLAAQIGQQEQSGELH